MVYVSRDTFFEEGWCSPTLLPLSVRLGEAVGGGRVFCRSANASSPSGNLHAIHRDNRASVHCGDGRGNEVNGAYAIGPISDAARLARNALHQGSGKIGFCGHDIAHDVAENALDAIEPNGVKR